MSKIKIVQNRGLIKCSARQKKTIEALGLKSRHGVVEIEESPAILGMIEKVKHLVSIEKIK
ncbi:MAG: 50S ribosomal protein L30 [Saprospiraceae bacterium]